MTGVGQIRRTMNTLTGSGVCLAIFGIALYMIVGGSRRLRQMKE